MNPKQLDKIGTLLYGPRWQSDMARRLNVNIRTVQRWAAGETSRPHLTLAGEMIEVIDERIEDLTKQLEELKNEHV